MPTEMSEARKYWLLVVIVLSVLFLALAFDDPAGPWPMQDSAPQNDLRMRTV
jgi:hypothetical protein